MNTSGCEEGRWTARARHVLAGEALDRAGALEILRTSDSELDDLLAGAFVLRSHHHGRRVKLHVLLNAKSGLCPEDCTFCAQSAYASTPIETYRLLPRDETIRAAREAKEAGAWKF